MGKMCSFTRHTTFVLSGIASLECKVVKNAKQCAGLLFTGAEILADLLCNLCSTVSNNPRAFGIFVECKLLSNFGIQSLEHFCLKFWRKFILKRAM
jgi:hypothetical protein